MLAGFLGIGGGIILVPVLVGLFGVGQHKAHGTSLSIIIPIAIVGATTYTLRGDINWVLVAAIAAGSIIGTITGVRIMLWLPAHRLRQVFGLYAIIIAVLLFVKVS